MSADADFQALCESLERNEPSLLTVKPKKEDVGYPRGYGPPLGAALQHNTVVTKLELFVPTLLWLSPHNHGLEVSMAQGLALLLLFIQTSGPGGFDFGRHDPDNSYRIGVGARMVCLPAASSTNADALLSKKSSARFLPLAFLLCSL
jgi:hypothetical protein